MIGILSIFAIRWKWDIEIGELLNISEDAAKKRGQRLIKKLQKLYEER